MKYTIRVARTEDMGQVLQLIQELAVFEREENAVEVTENDLIADGFGINKLFHCFVAESDASIVGMALVYPRYSTWKGPIIHLEDLIVSEKMRGTGLGTALLNEVVKYGKQLGVKRIIGKSLIGTSLQLSSMKRKGQKCYVIGMLYN